MKANTKQFLKDQLFFLDVHEKTKKGLEKNNLPSNLLKIAPFNFNPIFGLHAPLVIYDLCIYKEYRELMLYVELTWLLYHCLLNFKGLVANDQ